MTGPKKKKYSKPDTSVQLTSANSDPKSWLYKLVQEYNVIHALSAPCTDPATLLQGKLDLISETILCQQLLRAFYNAMKDPEERAKCRDGKVDGTTPSGLGGKTGLVKNVWTMASLLDAVTDTMRKFARELKNGDVEGWGDVDDDEMKEKIEKFLMEETAREWAEREGLVDGVGGENGVEEA